MSVLDPVLATGATATSLDIAWGDAGAGADFYNVSWDGGVTYTDVGNVTSYTITGLTSGQSYSIIVVSVLGIATQDTSIPITAYTVPPTPSSLSGAPQTATTSRLTFADPVTQAGSGNSLTIEQSAAGAGSWSVLTTGVSGATTYDAAGTANTNYDYRCKMVNGSPGGNSGYQTASSVLTGIAAPSGLNITARTTTSLELSWTDGAGTDTRDSQLDGSDYHTGTGIPETFSGLSEDSSHTLGIRDHRNSDGYTTGYATLVAFTSAAAPTSPAATMVSASEIDVDFDVTGPYLVQQSLTGSGGWSTATGGTGTGAGATTAHITGLSASTQYFFRVQQIGADTPNNDSAWSSTVDATTDASGGSVADGDGSASGSATVTGVGASLFVGAGSASGSAAVAGVGRSLFAGVGSSAGAASVSGVGRALFVGTGSSAGAGAASGVGASLAAGAGNASAAASASGVGASLAAAAGSGSGSASVVGIGASLAAGVGSSTGAAIVSAVGASLAAGVGASAGGSIVLGVGLASLRDPAQITHLRYDVSDVTALKWKSTDTEDGAVAVDNAEFVRTLGERITLEFTPNGDVPVDFAARTWGFFAKNVDPEVTDTITTSQVTIATTTGTGTVSVTIPKTLTGGSARRYDIELWRTDIDDVLASGVLRLKKSAR